MDDTKKGSAEPEVLWSCPATSVNGRSRFTRENGWEWGTGSGWAPHPQGATLVYKELGRRLLAEQAEQEKLDDHNDKLEEKAFAGWRRGLAEGRLNFQQEAHRQLLKEARALEQCFAARDKELGGLDRRLTELDKNLAREIEQRTLETKEQRRNCATYERVQADLIAKVEGLEAALSNMTLRPKQVAAPEAPPAGNLRWDRTQGIMVDDKDKIVLDLSDYFEDGNMSPADHDLLETLADLYCAWGPRGYLRERLVESATSSGPCYPGDAWRDHPDFRQLRSELLAFVWREGA